LGIDINYLDLVYDPIAAGKQTAAGVCTFLFHEAEAVMRVLVNEKPAPEGKTFLPLEKNSFPITLPVGNNNSC
jgi:hypothetical protein